MFCMGARGKEAKTPTAHFAVIIERKKGHIAREGRRVAEHTDCQSRCELGKRETMDSWDQERGRQACGLQISLLP